MRTTWSIVSNADPSKYIEEGFEVVKIIVRRRFIVIVRRRIILESRAGRSNYN